MCSQYCKKLKEFNLLSRTNETRYIEWHETCKCKCRLDATVCNNKQCWDDDKCRCECKELIEKGVCDKGFIWDPSNCKCDKSYDVSSVKWSHPAHFLKSQGKFFLSFPCTLFYIFLTPKNYR